MHEGEIHAISAKTNNNKTTAHKDRAGQVATKSKVGRLCVCGCVYA